MSLNSEQLPTNKGKLVPGMFSSVSDAELFTQMLAYESGMEEDPPKEAKTQTSQDNTEQS